MGGILLGDLLGCRTNGEAHDVKNKTTQKIKRNINDFIVSCICRRITNDMEILVCIWFKGTISLAQYVLHKALPRQIN